MFNPDQLPSSDDPLTGAACIGESTLATSPPPPRTDLSVPAGTFGLLRLETKRIEAVDGVCTRPPTDVVATVVRHDFQFYVGDTAALEAIRDREVHTVDGKWGVMSCRGSLLVASTATVVATGLSADAALARMAVEAGVPPQSDGYVKVAGPEDAQTGTVTIGEIESGVEAGG